MSEFLREKQGKSQVAQKGHRRNQSNQGDDVDLHGLPQLLTRLDVEERQAEENSREQQHRQILHGRSRSFIRQSPEKVSWEAIEIAERRSVAARLRVVRTKPVFSTAMIVAPERFESRKGFLNIM
jgi:hypothetical protein